MGSIEDPSGTRLAGADLAPVDLESLHAGLEGIETRLSDLWGAALAVDDGDLVERLVIVSHEVHRAALALVAPSPLIGAAQGS